MNHDEREHLARLAHRYYLASLLANRITPDQADDRFDAFPVDIREAWRAMAAAMQEHAEEEHEASLTARAGCT